MSNENPDQPHVSPPQEPAPTPLVSAADLSIEEYPTIHIPTSRFDVLVEHARRIADSWNAPRENHVTGLLGEDAVAQGLEVEESINTEVYPDGGDGGVDLRYRGATIDVKTVGRHRCDPALTVDIGQPLTADYYALVSRIGPTDFRLIGYAPRWFVANAPIREHEGRRYHLVDQQYLFPFPTVVTGRSQ